MGALPHSMAKHGRARRKRAFNLRRVRIAAGVVVGSLTAGDVISQTLTNVATDPMRIMSADLLYQLTDLGAVSDDGYEFGLAHSDYSATEIEECLEAAGSIDQGNKLDAEHANRLVRSIGVIFTSAIVGAGGTFNDGKPVKTKLNWRLSSGDTLVGWVRNSTGTVYTTGSVLTVLGNLWVKDI